MSLQLTIARGTEGDCYKCGGKIKAGQFIVFKPNYHGATRATGTTKAVVHEGCAPTKLKKHGGNVKKR